MTRFAAMLFAASLLAGCATDPLQDVPRLSGADVSDSDIQAAIRAEPDEGDVTDAASAPQSRGFLGRLLGGAADPEPTPAEAEADLDEAATAPEDTSATNTTEAPRGGLLGFLSRAARDVQAPAGERTTEVAAIPSQTQSDAPTTGIFGNAVANGGPGPDDPDYRIVPMGTVLPYGTLARVCDVRDRQLGARVEGYPDKRNTYAIYDSQPGNTAPHAFFVTGFGDGCARQFTAALAMFGSPETHEQLRYGLPSKVQPYSTTDAAYETLKSRICRVGKGKPCGSAMSRLSRDTVFVSVYGTFGSNPVWKTILLHDGTVIETDIRGN